MEVAHCAHEPIAIRAGSADNICLRDAEVRGQPGEGHPLYTYSKTLLPSDQTTDMFKGASLLVCPTRTTRAFEPLPTTCLPSSGLTRKWYCGFLMYDGLV